jgi:Mn2+/Fe2+ NRAMP family transporter
VHCRPSTLTDRPISRPRQAAEALRPLAGDWAYWLFTLGLIGTGMLGVPVLAGSCAYAVAEAEGWRGSLGDTPRLARRFYAVVAVSMLGGGLILNFVGLNAVAMLFWSAVVNGVLAAPLIVLGVLLTATTPSWGSGSTRHSFGGSAGRRRSS